MIVKTILVALICSCFSMVSLAQANSPDAFTNWKKVYNRADYGTDSTHYVYIRFKFCKHENKDGSPAHSTLYEVKYPDQPSDSTTLEADLYLTGNKKQIVDHNAYTSKDTINTFFAVTQGEVFNDEIALSFTEVTDYYIILRNVKTPVFWESNSSLKAKHERTKKLIKEDDKKKTRKIRSNVGGGGARG